jgi:hypothetical protein
MDPAIELFMIILSFIDFPITKSMCMLSFIDPSIIQQYNSNSND